MKQSIMRIAFVSGGLPFGGTTTFLHNLASGLLKAGVRCEIHSFTNTNPLGAEFNKAGITVHTRDERHFIFEDRLTQTLAALAKFKPSAVVANIGSEAYEVLRYVPRGVLRVGMIHDRIMQPARLIPAYHNVLDKVVVVSNHLLSDVRAVTPDIECAYLAHGIPMDSSVAGRAPNASGKLKLIYFGRITKGKGSRLFPVIAKALQQRQIPFQWTIHGDGADAQHLRQLLAADAVRGDVIFSSPVSRKDLPELVRKHDIYVHAADSEGGPLTLLEAMSLGLVPVCGDIPCLIQEVITPDKGFRVPRSDPEAYADAIAKLHADRKLLEKMSVAAKAAIASDFTVDAMAQRYVNFLQASKQSGPEGIWLEQPSVHPRIGSNPVFNWAPIRSLRRLMKRWQRPS